MKNILFFGLLVNTIFSMQGSIKAPSEENSVFQEFMRLGSLVGTVTISEKRAKLIIEGVRTDPSILSKTMGKEQNLEHPLIASLCCEMGKKLDRKRLKGILEKHLKEKLEKHRKKDCQEQEYVVVDISPSLP